MAPSLPEKPQERGGENMAGTISWCGRYADRDVDRGRETETQTQTHIETET